ncbi:MAG: succinate dehydrogenase [Acidobacteriota bacterium]|nr:succinate dehydrogenase [Acidobacteriota bacterium]
MPQIDVPLVQGRFGTTSRPDAWWIQPLVVFLGFSAFIVYSTWAAFQGQYFRFGPYISPMYSPELFGSPEAWFGGKPSWFPTFLPFSAAFLILWAPGGFRLTCYYYRGAYYKAFWADPPNCAVGEPRKKYLGERSFPLIVQNIHRYFMYLALIFIVLLAKDAYDGFFHWQDGFHVGVGSLVLLLNVILLGSYTLGCHSLRHLIGGISDTISKSPVRKSAYDCVSCLNARHMRFAWFSLFWVGFSDLYVRMCAMGIWHDWRLF